MSAPQILRRMCDSSVNKAFHGLAAILLVRLVGQPPKNVKNEICPHRCFAFYTQTARLNVKSPYKRGHTGTGKRQFRSLPVKDALTKWLPRTKTAWYILFSHYLCTQGNKIRFYTCSP